MELLAHKTHLIAIKPYFSISKFRILKYINTDKLLNLKIMIKYKCNKQIKSNYINILKIISYKKIIYKKIVRKKQKQNK